MTMYLAKPRKVVKTIDVAVGNFGFMKSLEKTHTYTHHKNLMFLKIHIKICRIDNSQKFLKYSSDENVELGGRGLCVDLSLEDIFNLYN